MLEPQDGCAVGEGCDDAEVEVRLGPLPLCESAPSQCRTNDEERDRGDRAGAHSDLCLAFIWVGAEDRGEVTASSAEDPYRGGAEDGDERNQGGVEQHVVPSIPRVEYHYSKELG